MTSRWLILILVVFASGCASTSHQLTLCGGMIQNRSGRELRDVRVVHYPTQKVVMTNVLLAGRSFRLGFEERALMATMATITWEDPDLGLQQSTLSLPVTDHQDDPRWLIYQITADGKVSVSLNPCQ